MGDDGTSAPPPSLPENPSHSTWLQRMGRLWETDPTGVSLDVLRVGMGTVWILNLIFVVDPANQFFTAFRDTALSFAPSTLGGPGVADFVAAHAALFAEVTAAITAYLAVAFVLGFTTRLACVVGAAASTVFLLTQLVSTFQAPGGTDVGPHPLYLLIYLILFVGGAGRYASLDHWMWAKARGRLRPVLRWFAGPRN